MQRPAAARQLLRQLRITEAMLCAELGPGAGPLPVPVRTLGRFREPQPCRRSLRSAPPSAAGRSKRGQQPGAGAAAVPGVMERGHRREPVSDRVPPAGGAGSDRAETPGPLLRGGPVGAGCRGGQCRRRGRRNPEGVAAPGALAGAATLPLALPARRCDCGSAPPRGHPLPVCVDLSGSAARASAEAALTKGPPDCQ